VHSVRALLAGLLGLFALLLLPSRALAASECNGPAECCVTEAAKVTTALPTKVRLGMRIRRLGTIDEQNGLYDAELTLLERWEAGGLRPDPRPRNVGATFEIPLDETRLEGGMCFREQRYNGQFLTWFRLHRFPFDSQNLRVNLEDRVHTEAQMLYDAELWPNTISADAYREIGGWRIADYPRIPYIKHSSFAFPAASAHPTLILVEIPVKRQYLFYVTRYFLPLFLIVVLAYCLFWIKADDLGSAASIGITCVLAIITFQITQADHLPRVPYLTIADLVYVVCYAATGLAVIATVREAYLVSQGRKADAEALDRRWRKLFPVLVISAIAASSVIGWRSEIDLSDIPNELPAPAAPAGEK
jgi:hypothetical protein